MGSNTCLHTHCENSIIFPWKRYHHKKKQLDKVAIQNKAITPNNISVNSSKETSPNKFIIIDDKLISNNRMNFDFQERPSHTSKKFRKQNTKFIFNAV